MRETTWRWRTWCATTAEPELSHRLQEPLEAGQLILNLRAEADPESAAKHR